MTGSEFILNSVLLGYFLAGMFIVIGIHNKQQTERPGFAIRFTWPKKLIVLAVWFIFAYQDIVHIHLPARARAIAYGLVTLPFIWVGYSVLAALILLPYLVMESMVLAFFLSTILFVAGSAFLAPIIAIGTGLVAFIVARPIIKYLPK